VRKALLLIAAIALPAAAAYSALSPGDALCFGHRGASYRIATGPLPPDFRIKIEDGAQRPDLRMQPVDRAEIADFVLVDDADNGAACRSSVPVRTVRLDAETPSPDVTVSLSAGAGPADYKIYVKSQRFSQSDAAALLAAMWKSDQRRELAAAAAR
jgi:hypothetical protein